MRTDWMAAISLALSAITLAVVLSVAARPGPQSIDLGPALAGLRSDMAQMRADIAELRASAALPTASPNLDQLVGIQARLDSIDSTVSGIATKFSALCRAVNSSPFGPPGGAC